LTSYGDVRINLGFFSLRGTVPVGCSVCLSCGFVAPYVDHGGLVAIREKARREGVEIHEKPSKKEFPEL